jgi:hypothetical protein
MGKMGLRFFLRGYERQSPLRFGPDGRAR